MHIIFFSNIQGTWRQQITSYIVAVACVINIVGDLVLVAGFNMNAAGAAIATVAAQAVSVVFALVLLFKRKLPFKIIRKISQLTDIAGEH